MSENTARVPMKNSTYDKLKQTTVYVLPALGTFYFSIAQLWQLPYPEEVVGTILAIELLLGGILGISNNKYKNSDQDTAGRFVINHNDPMKDNYRFELGMPITELDKHSRLTFKVHNEEPVEDFKPEAASQE